MSEEEKQEERFPDSDSSLQSDHLRGFGKRARGRAARRFLEEEKKEGDFSFRFIVTVPSAPPEIRSSIDANDLHFSVVFFRF